MKRWTLKEARTRKGFTQVKLAERTGLGQSHISALERGRRQEPERGTMRKLSAALQMEALLTTDGLVFEERGR
jgi:transcriptional regulator with XRE-family HTH domain